MTTYSKLPLTWGPDEPRRRISYLRRNMLRLRFPNACGGPVAILPEPDEAVESDILSPFRGVVRLFDAILYFLLCSLIFVDQASVDS
jgi:hypothetical protein